ncbi:hypothetical protein CDL12_26952 [Handroanthus impetiginosus]|uniref:Uncharacterized protein n=1 Tax=Handroanthus impetiginosus TaxID=429701 RepID=A0A2G9G5F3_9LAMI|nr:hypothetical protein CDL12_26952 [Handroanthus impetiginosus]
MGTKIQTNAFLREYHSVIDLDGSTNNGIRSLHSENQIQNGQNPHSFMSRMCKNLGYDLEKVRRTILQHESIFRDQLRELHRLYGRQQELMNEIKKREINKDNMNEDKSHSSTFLSPIPREDAKRAWNSICSSSLAGCLSTSRTTFLDCKSVPLVPPTHDTRSLRKSEPWLSKGSTFPNGTYDMQERFPKLLGFGITPCDRDAKLSLGAVQTPQRNSDSSTFDLYFKRANHPEDFRITNPRGEISAYSGSNVNLVMKDFFHNSIDRTNRESSWSILGFRNERRGKEQPSDDYAGTSVAGKSCAFPQSLSADPRKQFLNCPLDIGTSLSGRKRKIFGVEISEGNDDPVEVASDKTSILDLNIRHDQENLRVVSFESSSYIANSCMRNLELGGKKPAEVLEKDSENSEKLQLMVPQHHIMLADSRNHEENLPWFLGNSQVSGDQSKGKTNSYFMNLDSLQNCSEKFFKKAEIADRKDRVNEINDGTGAKKILGFPISDRKVNMDEDVQKNQLETENIVLHKGLNNYISDLKHHIDLNLSLDEDAQSAPSLPKAIVKIATTEIDLEAPAIIESETDACPKESEKADVLQGPSEVSYEEGDKIAAEAILAMSMSEKDNTMDDDDDDDDDDACLKWFAEIISSQCDEEESIPNGMDDFEFMTLKLEETKEEERYHYLPVLSNNPSDDETGNDTLSKRSQRGLSRRGRQRKDFQRDILPGLVTLSRLEVTEDLQTFEELGFSQRTSTRNGRGRKRLGGSNTSPPTKTPSSTQSEQLVCQLGERSLMGWGKRTRRVPRQRCPNAFFSFPIKC